MHTRIDDDIPAAQSANHHEVEASQTEDGTQPDGRGLKALWRKGKALWSAFSDVKASTYASSIAFFAFLSLIPLLTLCISLVTLVGVGESEVVEFFSLLVPETFGDLTKALVHDAYKGSGIAFSISTITLLWSASKGTRALHAGLNATFGVKETRSALAVVVASVVTALLLGILLAATMYFVFGGTVLRTLAWLIPGLENQGNVLNALNSVAMAVVGIVALSACYAFLPAGKRRLIAQLPGAALASVACGVLTIGFHVYVDNFCNAEALYGSIATIALFLFWMYLMAYILLAGAFVNRMLANRAKGNGSGHLVI